MAPKAAPKLQANMIVVTIVVFRNCGAKSCAMLGRLSVPAARFCRQIGDSGRKGRITISGIAGITPDIICLAKGLGGGFPMGAFAYTAAVRAKLSPGSHGSTFGGSPLACAAALAAIETYSADGLIERSATLGARVLADLRTALADIPIVREVRGLGLMIGIELRTKAAPVLKSLMLDHRVIALPAGPTVLRLLPPLVISDEEMALGISAIVVALKAFAATPVRRPSAATS